MQDLIRGTFHFHSTYSHDGRNTLYEIASSLKGRGLSFCVMTEHFEDFDEAKFDHYVESVNAISGSGDFLFIPGVEVNLSGIDTIFFPVRTYKEIAEFDSRPGDGESGPFTVVAHPTKYRFEDVVGHLTRYRIDGIELWNQQADGSRLPPLQFCKLLKDQVWKDRYHYFFGCDLHSANLTVANVISLPASTSRSSEAIANALISGDFVARNIPTGIEFRNGNGNPDFSSWLEGVQNRSYYQGRVLRGIRRCMRSVYKQLPRPMQHSLNDVKNFVRNKV